MKRHILAAAAISLVTLSAAGAFGQFYPGYGNYGWGGFMGPGALLGGNFNQSTLAADNALNRLQGEQATQVQNMKVVGNIRGALTSQAQSRDNALVRQQQGQQDWWFQQQAQLAAQRNAKFSAQAEAKDSRTSTNTTTLRPEFGPPGSPTAAATDIIKWPTLLQEPAFAAERAKIEAPYRRTPPRLSTPTAADYGNMARAIADMQAILQWRLREGVNTNQYQISRQFLAKLADETAANAQRAK